MRPRTIHKDVDNVPFALRLSEVAEGVAVRSWMVRVELVATLPERCHEGRSWPW